MADFTPIHNEIDTNLPTQNRQEITALRLRTTLHDMLYGIEDAEEEYEDQLSYSFREFKDDIQDQIDDFEGDVNGEIDNMKSYMRGKMDDFTQMINDFEGDVQDQIDDFTNDITGQQTDFEGDVQGQIDEFTNDITNAIKKYDAAILGYNDQCNTYSGGQGGRSQIIDYVFQEGKTYYILIHNENIGPLLGPYIQKAHTLNSSDVLYTLTDSDAVWWSAGTLADSKKGGGYIIYKWTCEYSNAICVRTNRSVTTTYPDVVTDEWNWFVGLYMQETLEKINTISRHSGADYINVDAGEFEIGSFDTNGAEADTPLRVRNTDFIRINGEFSVMMNTKTYRWNLLWYDQDKNYKGRFSSWQTNMSSWQKYDGYVRVLVKRADDGTFTEVPDDLNLRIVVKAGTIFDITLPEDDTNLPDYWTDYIDGKIGQINNLFRLSANVNTDPGVGGTKFILYTDIHTGVNALKTPYIINRIIKETKIKDAIFNGDILTANGKFNWSDRDKPAEGSAQYNTDLAWLRASMKQEFDRFTEYVKKVSDAGGTNYVVHGNHDLIQRMVYRNGNGDWVGPSDINDVRKQMIDKYVPRNIEPLNKTYYYWDDSCTNTRFIVVDFFEAGTTPQHSGTTDEQVAWLEDLLNNTATKTNIVYFSHKGFVGLVARDWLVGGSYVYDTRLWPLIRDKAGVCPSVIISGHHHHDAIIKEGGVWHISVASDAYYGDMWWRSPVRQLWGNMHQGADENFLYVRGTTPKLGTVAEQVFDIFNVDFEKDQIIKAIRFGNGKDRFIHTGTVYVGREGTSTLTPEYLDTTAEITYVCYDTDGYMENYSSTTGADATRWWTFRNSAVVNVSGDGTVSTGDISGGAMVIGIDQNGTQEYWYISVG